MEILKVKGLDADFYLLSKKLEEFQYSLMPILKEKDYNLTDDLHEVTGFVMYADKTPIGSVGFKKVSDDVCQIVRVFVDEKYRGNGYAGLLFEKVETLAKEQGFKRAEITAWCVSTSALKLYKKLGYTSSEEKISEWFGGGKYVALFKNF